MKYLNNKGVTLVELLVTISIISILSIVLMNFMVEWVKQYAITNARASLLTSAQDTLDIVTDSIRLSAAADQNNRWQDAQAPNAPSDLLSWESNSSTLVLASAVEDQDGTILFSDPLNYTSHKNNLIFFVNDGTLYQRTLAAPVAGNSKKSTCPAVSATSDCPADKRLAQNVSEFTVSYRNAENQTVTPTNARSIELTLTLTTKQFGQTIQSSDKTRMVFRND